MVPDSWPGIRSCMSAAVRLPITRYPGRAVRSAAAGISAHGLLERGGVWLYAVLRVLLLLEGRLQLCSVGAVKIYFAGPLFTPYERSFIDECAAALRADGFEVFVPHEHELATGLDVTAATILAKDRTGIGGADAMLAILDGPSVDDGTACEIGMFHALMQSDPSKKGIVGLLTDIRGMRGESTGVNLFVQGAIEDVGRIVASLEEARDVLRAWR